MLASMYALMVYLGGSWRGRASSLRPCEAEDVLVVRRVLDCPVFHYQVPPPNIFGLFDLPLGENRHRLWQIY